MTLTHKKNLGHMAQGQSPQEEDDPAQARSLRMHSLLQPPTSTVHLKSAQIMPCKKNSPTAKCCYRRCWVASARGYRRCWVAAVRGVVAHRASAWRHPTVVVHSTEILLAKLWCTAPHLGLAAPLGSLLGFSIATEGARGTVSSHTSPSVVRATTSGARSAALVHDTPLLHLWCTLCLVGALYTSLVRAALLGATGVAPLRWQRIPPLS